MVDLKRIIENYLKVMNADGISKENLDCIEKSLSVTLPDDFRSISEYFSGGYIGPINMYDFIGSDITIVSETLKLREVVELPCQYVVLAEPPESLLIMNTKESPSIIWCDSGDAENIKSSKYLVQPNKWESYSDFFYDMVMDMIDEI